MQAAHLLPYRQRRSSLGLALEMVGDERQRGVVAGFGVGLVAGDEDGEVFFGGEPGHGEPHVVAAGVGEGGAAAGPRLPSWCQCRTMPSRFPQPRRTSIHAEIDRGEYWTI